ncbi:MAG: hypothetical protein OEM97_03695, partial [Acidimicrobiia bacterium]|nr:hypothetical protein [Acidimicrobiia bacterium]
FLGTGGAFADQGDSTLYLSRIFLWYGADFVKPHRMPALIPARRRQIASAVKPWMSPELAAWFDSARPRVVFQAYDWALGCGLS